MSTTVLGAGTYVRTESNCFSKNVVVQFIFAKRLSSCKNTAGGHVFEPTAHCYPQIFFSEKKFWNKNLSKNP